MTATATTTTARARPVRRGLSLALLIRQVHAYVSVFLAPTILFFAITGCLQVYSFHEAHGAYTPPPLLDKLGALHKNQAFHAKPPPPKAPAPGAPPRRDKMAGLRPAVLVLKAFTFAAGACLSVSTILGVWMAVRYTRRPRLSWALLALGIVVPLLTFALP